MVKQLSKKIRQPTERRKHGCDGCREDVPTEQFNGHCNNRIWLCDKCLIKLILGEFAQT